jgi:NAD(P)-dependent dehydrogenase (short-subunit alcohol dehydrogenase family)
MLSSAIGAVSFFVSSETALNIPTEMIQYAPRKTAQLAISHGLAELTKGTAVTVNSISPGPTSFEGVETFVKELAKQNGRPEEETAVPFVKRCRSIPLMQRFPLV